MTANMAETGRAAKTLATGAVRMSKRLWLSYIIDWVLILGLAGIGGGFNKLKNTNKRPFSLQDPSISYPYKDDTVSVGVLLIVSIIAPGVITAVTSLVLIPGPTATKSTPKSLVWRRKLWEWNTAWMGLGLSLASAFMITEGLKDLAGKPRPHAIGRCNPDLNAINQYRVGGLGTSFDATGATPILVSSGICQENDPAVLRETFASWPSGHSSFSFAGLLYLSLYLCAKFAVGIPYLQRNQKAESENTFDYDQSLRNSVRSNEHDFSSSSTTHEGRGNLPLPARNSTAAPPIYLLILTVFVPVGTAVFICVSRWFDFHHHGIDILSGAILGAFTAIFSFRYYHMSIRRGSGWAWGARSRGRAFLVGVGRNGYVGEEGWAAEKAQKKQHGDLEAGSEGRQKTEDVLKPGVPDVGDRGGSGSSP